MPIALLEYLQVTWPKQWQEETCHWMFKEQFLMILRDTYTFSLRGLKLNLPGVFQTFCILVLLWWKKLAPEKHFINMPWQTQLWVLERCCEVSWEHTKPSKSSVELIERRRLHELMTAVDWHTIKKPACQVLSVTHYCLLPNALNSSSTSLLTEMTYGKALSTTFCILCY